MFGKKSERLLGSGKWKTRKYQRSGALPLLGMVGKLAGKALLNLVENIILNWKLWYPPNLKWKKEDWNVKVLKFHPVF